MDPSTLEFEALKLSSPERARLAARLLDSLDELTDEEHERLWSEEAARRAAEALADPAVTRPAEDVFRDARARIR